MKNLQVLADKTAIGLSALCTLHCLALPLFLVLVPSVTALGLDSEAFHLWMVMVVLPMSAYALTLGCKEHNKYYVIFFGVVGLFCLVGAVVFGESFLGEAREKTLTTVGGGIIACAHYKNYRLCQHQKKCTCSEHNHT